MSTSGVCFSKLYFVLMQLMKWIFNINMLCTVLKDCCCFACKPIVNIFFYLSCHVFNVMFDITIYYLTVHKPESCSYFLYIYTCVLTCIMFFPNTQVKQCLEIWCLFWCSEKRAMKFLFVVSIPIFYIQFISCSIGGYECYFLLFGLIRITTLMT